MKKSLLTSLIAATAASVLPLASLHAAANATDNANDPAYSGGFDGVNGGTGFGTNTLSNNGTGGFGSFIGSATGNGNGGSGGTIDTNGKSFGLFANSGALIQDTRSFTAGGPNGNTALAVGQTFSLSLDNGFINTGSTVGFNLLNTAGTSQFTFQFLGGNADYTYSIGTGAQTDTGVGYTDAGLSIAFAKGAGNAFTLTITPQATGVATTITGALAAGATISQFQVFNNNAAGTNTGPNYDLFFNSPTVVPEPGSWAASLAGIGLLVGVQRLRRRRA